MDQTKELVKTIVEGLQEKRGKNIVTVDLSQTSGAKQHRKFKNIQHVSENSADNDNGLVKKNMTACPRFSNHPGKDPYDGQKSKNAGRYDAAGT